ncbi:MAG: hypothetical protein AAF489_03605 [Bacteroidota bacterium]
MNKHYLLKQPPLAEKFTFLVDVITDDGNYGLATDIDKVNYNRQLIGELNKDVKIGLLMSENKGSTFVFDLGNFITVLEISSDELDGMMAFYHCVVDVGQDQLLPLLEARYSKKVAREWFALQEKMLANFSPDHDIVQLHRPEV